MFEQCLDCLYALYKFTIHNAIKCAQLKITPLINDIFGANDFLIQINRDKSNMFSIIFYAQWTQHK